MNVKGAKEIAESAEAKRNAKLAMGSMVPKEGLKRGRMPGDG